MPEASGRMENLMSTMRTKTLLVLLTAFTALTPFAAGHYYQGPNPQDCPDDGQVHEHRYTNGDLYCASHPCTNGTSGVDTIDPLTGRRTFQGPVLVTSTYRGPFAEAVQFSQPEVWTQAHGTGVSLGQGELAADNQATVVFIASQRTQDTASSTWLVMAGPDVQTYTVNFRAIALSPAGASECSSEHEQRN
jgi:hypothetical protein